MDEWATVNRHLQSIGTATCDVGHLILQAEILREEEKNNRAAEMLVAAARDVLHHRRLARRRTPPLRAATKIKTKSIYRPKVDLGPVLRARLAR